MESFYGGQQGFSFVVKKNPNNNSGYFTSKRDINSAAQSGALRYGDYAIVTGQTTTENIYNSEHGDLYRINAQNQAEKVANISHPALSTLIKGFNSFNDNIDVNQTATINFLNKENSKEQETLDLSWEYERNNDEITGIRIGIKAPQPVIEFELEKTDSYKKQIQPMVTGGPFYKKFNVQEPRQVDIISSAAGGGNNLSSDDVEDGLIIFNERSEIIELKNYEPSQSGGNYILTTGKINISSWSNFTLQYTGSVEDASSVNCLLMGYDLTQLPSEGHEDPPIRQLYDLSLATFLEYIENNGMYRPSPYYNAYLEMTLTSRDSAALERVAESLAIKSYF